MQRRQPGHQEPLADRVDRAGIRQRTDPEDARASRDRERGAPGTDDAVGWWYFDGQTWAYHGEDVPEALIPPQARGLR